MHSVKVEAHRHYASISPKAELKVQVLNESDIFVMHESPCSIFVYTNVIIGT